MPESKLDAMEEYFIHVGFLVAWWNKAEEEADDLLICLIGDVKRAHILTHKQSIANRITTMKRLLDECFPEADWRDTALAGLDALNILRENRNTIIHGVATRLDIAQGTIALRNITNNPLKRTFRNMQITHKTVVQQLDLVAQMGAYLRRVRQYAFPNGPVRKLADLLDAPHTLPKRFPLPDRLPSPENPTPNKRQVPPQSSEA